MRNLFALVLILLYSGAVFAQKNSEDNPLEKLLNSNPALQQFIDQKDSLGIQIIYTQINRNRRNKPRFASYSYNLNNNSYFYPASTVKMPIAFLALEKLRELNIKGLNRNTTMITDSSSSMQDYVYNQPNASDGRPTIENYIQQIFQASSNDAFNRLYEFLGQEYIQQKLTAKGYPDAIIRHRLQITRTAEQNATTNGVRFYDTSGNLLYSQPAQISKAVYPAVDAKLGKGYYADGKLVNEPFSFALKNRVYLTDFHQMLQSVIFPEQFSKKQRFNLSASDLSFIQTQLSNYAGNGLSAGNKILYYGSGKDSVNPNIRIFNKTGGAYGFLLDVSYVADQQHQIEYMLSAVISCNQDGIYNDDQYEYNTVGYPFMKELGKAVHQYEINRARKYPPILNVKTELR